MTAPGSPPAPAYGRDKLLRVLALPAEAERAEIEQAGERLRAWLEQRLAELPPGPGPERVARERELADLVASLAYWSAAPQQVSPGQRPSERWGTLATLGLVLLAIALMIAGVTDLVSLGGEGNGAGGEPAALYRSRARIEIEAAPEGALLRVLDADRSELLDERPAGGARIELEPGRYALEVRREDCPDVWTRSVFLEPESVHRFRPTVCAGEGELVVRSNAAEDRLRIDDLDVGHTGPRAHRLPVGDHTIRVDKPGHKPFEARVRVVPGETVELKAELLPLAEAEPVGRPLPVSHVAPSPPPVDREAVESFKQEVLAASFELPPIQPDEIELPSQRGFLAREGLPVVPDGGSTGWHDRVSKQLRERYDRDGSGEIDRLEESEAIDCSVWREIERDFDRGGLGLSLAHYYGFDGSEWHPGALAVARAHRSAVYARMQECGLEP